MSTRNYDLIKIILHEQTGVDARLDREAFRNAEKAQKDAAAAEVRKKEGFDSQYIVVETPPNKFEIGSMPIPRNSKFTLWEHPIDPTKVFGFDKWVNTGWENYIPDAGQLQGILPEGSLRQFTTPEGTSYMAQLRRLSNPPKLQYEFDWFYDKEGNPYKYSATEVPDAYKPKTWWQEWGPVIIQIAVSVTAGILTAGASIITQLVVQGIIDLAFVGYQVAIGDNFGAALALVLGCVPFIGHFAKFGFNKKVLGSLITKINGKSQKQIALMLKKTTVLSEAEKQVFKSVFQVDKDILVKATSKKVYDDIAKAVADGKIVLEKIPMLKRVQWKRFTMELGTSAGIIGGGVLYKYFDGKAQAEELRQGVANMENYESRLGNEEQAISRYEQLKQKYKQQNNMDQSPN